MIILAGEMVMEPAVIADFEHAVAAMREGVLAEAGCRFYSLLVQDATSGTVHVLEMWDDDEALAVHLTQPVIGDFFARFGPRMTSTTIKVYDVAGERAVPGL